MEIKGTTTTKELAAIPELKAIMPYILFGQRFSSMVEQGATLEEICVAADWHFENIKDGTEHLLKRAKAGNLVEQVYDQEEIRKDPSKKDVNITCFPATVDLEEKPFVIVCAGGAFTDVCSLGEAYPLAEKMNRLGYQVFALTYRVGGKALFPRPMDDLAAALRYILDHKQKYNITSEKYIVAGFSAGGMLTAQWGTVNHGYRVYDLPKPYAMFPIYPAVSARLFEISDLLDEFCTTMWGDDYDEAIKEEYDVLLHMDQDYPPCYINCCKDDPVVPWESSKELAAKLEKLRIPVEFELGEQGGHGYGIGDTTDLAGWVARAVDFSERLFDYQQKW